MDYPETQTTLGTRHRMKTNKTKQIQKTKKRATLISNQECWIARF